jgi:7-cyano-7-deazaguanine synthase
MCSIYGFAGREVDTIILDSLREAARDRGRDGTGEEAFDLCQGRIAVLGNHRAAPVPEREGPNQQPIGGVVHNGTIANAVALGLQYGEVDSAVLHRILDRRTLGGFARSIENVVGSYALAATSGSTVFLARNYKPLYYYSEDGKNFYFSSMARHFEEICYHGSAPVEVPPYCVMDLLTGASLPVRRLEARRAVVVASAGLDSTVAATKLLRDGWEIELVHYQYGCIAQTRETDRIAKIAAALGVPHKVLPLPYSHIDQKATLLAGDPSKVSEPEAGAEFAHEWVPARNLVLMSMSVAYAEANGFHAVALGNNLEESGSYPDNEEELTYLMNRAMTYAVHDGYKMEILCPVGTLMKHEIVRLGVEVNAPMHLTWSCYRNGEQHCGRCPSCYLRRTAFERNNLIDPVMP